MKKSFKILDKRNESKPSKLETTLDPNRPGFEYIANNKFFFVPPQAFEKIKYESGYWYVKEGMFVANDQVYLDTTIDKALDGIIDRESDPYILENTRLITTWHKAKQITEKLEGQMLPLSVYHCVRRYAQNENPTGISQDSFVSKFEEWIDGYIKRSYHKMSPTLQNVESSTLYVNARSTGDDVQAGLGLVQSEPQESGWFTDESLDPTTGYPNIIGDSQHYRYERINTKEPIALLRSSASEHGASFTMSIKQSDPNMHAGMFRVAYTVDRFFELGGAIHGR